MKNYLLFVNRDRDSDNDCDSNNNMKMKKKGIIYQQIGDSKQEHMRVLRSKYFIFI